MSIEKTVSEIAEILGVSRQAVNNRVKQLPEEYTRGISRVYDTQENIGIDSDLTIFPVESKDDFPDGLTTIAPIYGGGMRLGSFIIWRNDHDFVDEDLILVEIASTVVGLQLLNLQTENLEETMLGLVFNLDYVTET